MSFHSDLIAGAASPLLLETHGETVTVRIKGQAAGVTVTALVGPERTREKQTERGRTLVKQRRITFTTDEASRFGGVASLPMNATLTHAGNDYAIAEKPSEADGMVQVTAERNAARHGGSRSATG